MTNPDCYNHLFKWLEIRREHGLDFPSSIDQLKISMMKSALLSRLFEGKTPLPIPPPKSYSYPWYDLIEKETGISTDVWKADDWVEKLHDYPTLYIDQFAWKIIKEISSEEWLITYSYKSYEMEKFCEDTWHLYKKDDFWVIKKIIHSYMILR